MIRSAADVPGGFTARTQVCVVGSGAGGGVAAALLAEGGQEVLVLEEGSHVPGSQMTQRAVDMYPRLYRDGGNQFTSDGAVNVLQGRTLGGSTVINMADVCEVPDGVHAHWQTVFGVDRYSLAHLREADDACRKAIGANQILETELNRNNALLLEGGRKLGLKGGAFIHNRVGCVGSGFCVVGCAYDAKRSVALTWIPRAIQTGRALVQTEARLSHYEVHGGKVVAAIGDMVEPISGRALGPFRVEADRFILSAGAIHSPVLLQKSGLGGPQVGRNLSLQPQAALASLYPDEVVLFRGIPQASYLDHYETATAADGLGGYRLEGVSGPPALAALMVPLGAHTTHQFMADLRRVASSLCLVPDRPVGRVQIASDGRPKIVYPMQAAWKQSLVQSIHTAARVHLAAGAEAVLLPFAKARPVTSEADLKQLESLVVRPSDTPLLSAHPQGTCRMGTDPKKSVVGLDLKVHGTENLWVADASIFPTTSSTHTMLPTMSYAWMAMRDLAT